MNLLKVTLEFDPFTHFDEAFKYAKKLIKDNQWYTEVVFEWNSVPVTITKDSDISEVWQKRETDRIKLNKTNFEVFFAHQGPRKLYDRVYVMDLCNRCEARGCDKCPKEGWYWREVKNGVAQFFSICGPFNTDKEAETDALNYLRVTANT